jgi:cytochrome d ubiquinol oxidase subunit II
MFEFFSFLTLQHYWWAVMSLMAAVLVFLMFVQGGQSLIYQIGKTENERNMIVNTLGRKWESTFTTLVTFGAAFFASFPLFYSTSFSGAFWAWIILLFSFIIQAVSYEYRRKPDNFLGRKTFDAFLFVNGMVGPLLIGTVVGTFFNGSDFSIDNMNIPTWHNSARGLESFGNFFNVSLGLAVLFLSRVLGLLFIINTIDNRNIREQTKKHLWYNFLPFLLFFLIFLIHILVKDGSAYNPETMKVFMEPLKYFHNFIQMPLILILFLLGVISVVWGVITGIFKTSTKGIWFSGAGTILTVFSLFIIAGYNNTNFYPSNYDLQSSLNIQNSSSSRLTLATMSYVSLLFPVILAYVYIAMKPINNKKITDKEISGETESHLY